MTDRSAIGGGRRRTLDGGPSPFRAPASPTALDDRSPASFLNGHIDLDRHRGSAPGDGFDDEPDTVPDHDPRLGPVPAPVPRPRRVRRRTGRTRSVLGVAATVVGITMIAAGAAGAVLLLRDHPGRTPGTGASAATHGAAPATPPATDARATDPEPLTVVELFGGETFTAPSGGTYTIAAAATAACSDLASDTGDDRLGAALADAGCDRAVRAALVSPDGEYALTVGVVDLVDAAAARELRTAVEDGAGDFTTLHSEPTGRLGRSATVLGFNTYGHYLLYAIMGPADGTPADRSEPVYAVMAADVLDGHLTVVLSERG